MSSLFNSRPDSIADLRDQWHACEKCYFAGRWKEYGPCLPVNDYLDKTVLVLGQWPGESDMQQGIPFSGTQGIISRRLLQNVGFSPNKIFYTNTLLCTCPVVPTKSILQNCYDQVDQTLDLVQPKLIIGLGNIAAKRLGLTKGLVGNRKKIHYYRNYPTALCLHTAAIDRQKSREKRAEMTDEVVADLEFALKVYRGLV